MLKNHADCLTFHLLIGVMMASLDCSRRKLVLSENAFSSSDVLVYHYHLIEAGNDCNMTKVEFI